jgi:RNA polymerase sigma factor (sigma-70 family)
MTSPIILSNYLIYKRFLRILSSPVFTFLHPRLLYSGRDVFRGRADEGRGALEPRDKQAFVADIEKQHGQRLRRFLASRLRHRLADVPDLVQEVFLRFLRIDNLETIRSSEAYLFTVAFHVLHQHVLRRSAMPEAVEIGALIDEMESAPENDPAMQAERQQQLEELQRALHELSPKAQAVLLLHRRDGYSLEEIGKQLGISRAMAAKYLSKALFHCRYRLQEKQVK